MPKPTKGPRLGGSPSHERIILANLATQLFEHGSITTTVTRAKRMQPLAEHLITKARRGGLHDIRVVGKTVKDAGVLNHLFKEIGPSLAGRDGGYTRITRIGTRKGDGAPMAIIEIITEEVSATKKPATRRPAAKPKAKDEEFDDFDDLFDDDLEDDIEDVEAEEKGTDADADEVEDEDSDDDAQPEVEE